MRTKREIPKDFHINAGKKVNILTAHYHASARTIRRWRWEINYGWIEQLTKGGEHIAYYSTLAEAEYRSGCKKQNISACYLGKIKSCGGFIWKKM